MKLTKKQQFFVNLLCLFIVFVQLFPIQELQKCFCKLIVALK